MQRDGGPRAPFDPVSVSFLGLIPPEASVTSHVDDEGTRRDFLVVAGNAFAAVGAASLIWPFVQQMNPDASAKALASVEVDLSPVKEGQAITALWRGKPLFIRNRTKDEIDAAAKVEPKDLPDGAARNDAMAADAPAIDANRVDAMHRHPDQPTPPPCLFAKRN